MLRAQALGVEITTKARAGAVEAAKVAKANLEVLETQLQSTSKNIATLALEVSHSHSKTHEVQSKLDALRCSEED